MAWGGGIGLGQSNDQSRPQLSPINPTLPIQLTPSMLGDGGCGVLWCAMVKGNYRIKSRLAIGLVCG